MREAGRRIKSIHLRNSVGKVWSESLGEGDIDYQPLSAYLQHEHLSPFLVVELAYESGTPHTRSLGENLRMGREYVERVFGGEGVRSSPRDGSACPSAKPLDNRRR